MSDKNKPLWHGVVLVAGGAIGAGMFALPLVASGAWYLWSVVGLLIVWWFTYLAAKLLIEVNQRFEPDSSFDTLVKHTLGSAWAWVNNASIAFIMFILMYAYITAGSRILQPSGFTIAAPYLSVMFAACIALLIYLGTSIVSRVSTLLMLAMVLSFCSATLGLFSTIELDSLVVLKRATDTQYLGAALPVFVTAFACAGLVPSLLSHYANKPEGQQKVAVMRSVFWGSLLAFLVYTLWLSVTLGNIPQADFAQLASDGGELAALIARLQGSNTEQLNAGLSWFSHFAVITSFLSIALGLVHFLSDRFGFGTSRSGKLKAVVAAFLPPAVFSVLLPYGFVRAIGFAGLFVAFSFFIIPAMMHAKQFAKRSAATHWVFVFGVAIVVLKFASLAAILPVYP